MYHTVANLPQSRLEPILVRYAAQNGFRNRFDTKLLSFEQDGKIGRIESVAEDLIAKQKILVRSKYRCGADGASSTIVRELQLPLHNLPGGGLSINLLVEAGYGETLTLAQSDSECCADLLCCKVTFDENVCRPAPRPD